MLLKYDVDLTPELRVNSFAIRKQGAPTLRLAADTEEAAARWMTVIREAVERNNQVRKASRYSSRPVLHFSSIFDASLLSTLFRDISHVPYNNSVLISK